MQRFPCTWHQFGEVFVVGSRILVGYFIRGYVVAVAVYGVILRLIILRFVVTVYFHVIVTGQIAAVFARIVEVKTVLSLSHTLRHDEHSVICSVENKLAKLGVRHIVEVRASQFEGEHVAYHALVGERSEQRPVVVLAHSHYLHLLLLASLLERFVQRTERVWLLVRAVERRVAAISQRHIAFIIHFLVRISYRVAIVVLAFAVVNDFHPGCDTVLTLYHPPVNIDEDNRHIGLRQFHVGIVGRQIIIGPLRIQTCRNHHQWQQ